MLTGSLIAACNIGRTPIARTYLKSVSESKNHVQLLS